MLLSLELASRLMLRLLFCDLESFLESLRAIPRDDIDIHVARVLFMTHFLVNSQGSFASRISKRPLVGLLDTTTLARTGCLPGHFFLENFVGSLPRMLKKDPQSFYMMGFVMTQYPAQVWRYHNLLKYVEPRGFGILKRKEAPKEGTRTNLGFIYCLCFREYELFAFCAHFFGLCFC